MKSPRLLLIASAALLFALAGGQALAQRFDLVTASEAAREGQAAAKSIGKELPEIRARSLPVPGRPVLAIDIVEPATTTTLAAPVRIELQFRTPPGARVVPSTFRVLYGVLKLDLTERLRRFAKVSESGVVVEQAVLPEGLHRLFLHVGDDKGNVAEQELRVRVGATS